VNCCLPALCAGLEYEIAHDNIAKQAQAAMAGGAPGGHRGPPPPQYGRAAQAYPQQGPPAPAYQQQVLSGLFVDNRA